MKTVEILTFFLKNEEIKIVDCSQNIRTSRELKSLLNLITTIWYFFNLITIQSHEKYYIDVILVNLKYLKIISSMYHLYRKNVQLSQILINKLWKIMITVSKSRKVQVLKSFLKIEDCPKEMKASRHLKLFWNLITAIRYT